MSEFLQVDSQTRNLGAALKLAADGFAVFPVNPANKKPFEGFKWKEQATDNETEIRKLWQYHKNAMPAMPTGRRNGVAVLDVDRKDGKDGFAGFKDRGINPADLSSFEVKTPSGGSHFYFEWPEGLGNADKHLPKGVEVRAEGGYVVAVGAITPDGKYEGTSLGNATYVGLHTWPAELLPPARSVETSDSKQPSVPIETLRSALMAIPNDGGNVDGSDIEREEWVKYGAAIHFETEGSAEGLELFQEFSERHPTYHADHTEQAWESFGRTSGPICTGKTILAEARKYAWKDEPILDLFEEGGETYQLDEDGVIRAFTAKHKDVLRFDHHAGKWYQFDGNVWRGEETRLAHHYAREISTTMAEADPKAKPLRRVNVWEAIERGARTAREFVVTSADWNRDPYMLGTPGGTVDLRTGELSSGEPGDLISRATAVAPVPLVEFNPKRDCPQWMSFLHQALAGDEESIRFLQQWGGYSLTGDTKEQALIFVHGPGGSGKSTAINTMADILGEYSVAMATSTLTAQKHEAHAQEIARLDGPRMAWASETEKGKPWAENRIKSLTGGDTLTANYMRQNSFNFKPQFKLSIVGNNQPSLTSVDDAIKRRFIILPFDHPPKVKDAELSNKLRKEWPGILSWMIQGCLDWQENGLVKPEAARDATDSYFAEQDVFQQWLDDCCMVADGEIAKFPDLWESWSSYARRQGEAPGSKLRSFPETLNQRGFEAIKDTAGIRGRGYRGLSLLVQDITGEFDDFV